MFLTDFTELIVIVLQGGYVAILFSNFGDGLLPPRRLRLRFMVHGSEGILWLVWAKDVVTVVVRWAQIRASILHLSGRRYIKFIVWLWRLLTHLSDEIVALSYALRSTGTLLSYGGCFALELGDKLAEGVVELHLRVKISTDQQALLERLIQLSILILPDVFFLSLLYLLLH